MRIGLLLPLLFVVAALGQNLTLSNDNSSVAVIGFKWLTIHKTIKKQEAPNMAPPPEMTAGNKIAARTARANNPLIPDPNEQTIDGRSAAIEKIVQEARTANPKPVDGFEYQARIQNTGKKSIEIVFWEYQFVDPANKTTTRRQFLCGAKIKPDKEKELQAFSLLGPSDVVNATTLANNAGNLFQEKVLINRVEYADGSIWQRKDWNFAEIKLTYKRAIETPWESEMCRSL